MPTEAEWMQALRNADRAGDTEDARKIAQIIQRQRDAAPPPSKQSGPRSIGGVQFTAAEADALQAARAAGDEDTMRKVAFRAIGRGSLRQPRSFGEAVGQSTESLLRGAGQGAFGVGDHLAAAGTGLGQFLSGQDVGTHKENLEFQRGRRDALNERAGVAGGAGLLTGAVASGGLAVRGAGAAGKALPVGTKATKLFSLTRKGRDTAGNLIPLTKGQVAGNVLKLSAGGAAAGGVTGGLEDGAGGAKTGAITGAVAGPLVGPALAGGTFVARKLGGVITRGAKSALGKADTTPSLSGIAALAAKVSKDRGTKVTADDLQKAYDSHVARTGNQPSLAEITSPQVLDEVAKTVRARPRAVNTILDSTQESSKALQGRLEENIRGPLDKTFGSAKVKETASDIFKEFMDENGDRPIQILAGDRNFLHSSPIRNSLSGGHLSNLRRKIANVQEGQDITLLDLNDIRQNLSGLINSGQKSTEFINAKKVLDKMVERKAPDLAGHVKRFGALNEFAKRIDDGAGLLSEADTANKLSTILKETAEEAAGDTSNITGRRVGVVQRLASKAGDSPQGAAETARTLAENKGARDKIRAVFKGDPTGTAKHLLDMSKAELDAARNLRRLAQRVTNAPDTAISPTDIVVDLAFLSQAGGAFRAGFIEGLHKSVKISSHAANNIAEDILDPSKTQAAIKALRAHGMREQDISKLLLESAASTGILSADAVVNEDTP